MLKYLSAYVWLPSKLPCMHSDVKIEPFGRGLTEPEGYQVIPRYYDFLRDVSRDGCLFIYNRECVNSYCDAVNSFANSEIH